MMKTKLIYAILFAEVALIALVMFVNVARKSVSPIYATPLTERDVQELVVETPAPEKVVTERPAVESSNDLIVEKLKVKGVTTVTPKPPKEVATVKVIPAPTEAPVVTEAPVEEANPVEMQEVVEEQTEQPAAAPVPEVTETPKDQDPVPENEPVVTPAAEEQEEEQQEEPEVVEPIAIPVVLEAIVPEGYVLTFLNGETGEVVATEESEDGRIYYTVNLLPGTYSYTATCAAQSLVWDIEVYEDHTYSIICPSGQEITANNPEEGVHYPHLAEYVPITFEGVDPEGIYELEGDDYVMEAYAEEDGTVTFFVYAETTGTFNYTFRGATERRATMTVQFDEANICLNCMVTVD